MQFYRGNAEELAAWCQWKHTTGLFVWRDSSHAAPERVGRSAAVHAGGNDRYGAIGILGLTYKPDTDVVEEAFGLLLAQELSAANIPVVVYDPSADAPRALGQNKAVRCAASAQECIAQSDVVVLATPWQEFREVPAAQWARQNRPRAVVDCWRVLNHLDGVDGVRYVRLGFGGEAVRPLEASSAAD